jgi:hypothetical protein
MKALVFCPNGERITRSEKAVGMVLADSHQDRGNSFTYPALDTIAEESASPRRTAQRLQASLERKGVLLRMRPRNQGRGTTVFYFFTALDVIPAGWKDAREGRHSVALFDGELFLHKGDRRATEGRQKGGNLNTAPVERAREPEQEQQKQLELTPLPPASGGAVDRNQPSAVVSSGAPPASVNPPCAAQQGRLSGVGDPLETAADQVMQGCGFVQKRLRRVLRAAIEHEVNSGEHPATAALAMMAAWKRQLLDGDVLRVIYGPEKFFGHGHWSKPLQYDPQALERERMRANARVGSVR